ncbi:FUSC family protein [Tsukamurella sp. NPDC003166]|uniref:FUSC family protein n=1 Tax=Tsukamurella sp. NPDC003166 TaxID=3154444 RepID=UPI0033A4952C
MATTALRAVGTAAIRGLRPGRPLHDPTRLARVAVGMIVAAVIGYALHEPVDQMILCVGAFLSAIGCLMPHTRHRLAAASGTAVALVGAAAVGAVIMQRWWVVIPLVAVGLFVGGLCRVVTVGLSMRIIVVTITFLAFAEITPSRNEWGGEIGLFAAGAAIMVAAQFLPPYEPRYAVQREALAALYERLATDGPYGPALLAAERSVATVHRLPNAGRRTALIELAEQIGRLRLIDESSAADRAAIDDDLRAVAAAIRSTPIRSDDSHVRDEGPLPADVDAALRSCIENAMTIATGGPARRPSDDHLPPSALDLVREELRPSSPYAHHAARLAVSAVVGQLAGMAIGAALAPRIVEPAHGFWVVVAVVLILVPDYGETFSRGIARTIGTLLGAALGIGIAFLGNDPLLHTIILIVLFLGYLAFRSCGQPWTMFWVVAWIGILTPGPEGALTRGLYTVVGCVIAFATYAIAPTWHRPRLRASLLSWADAEADRLAALAALWRAPSEAHRLTVAEATGRSRLARIEFTTAGELAQREPARHDEPWSNESIDAVSGAVLGVAREVAALAGRQELDTDAQAGAENADDGAVRLRALGAPADEGPGAGADEPLGAAIDSLASALPRPGR